MGIKILKYLVDSNIFIYHLNGIEKATSFLTANIDDIAISFITYIEVLAYNMTPEENQKVRELLDLFIILQSDSSICEKTIEIRKNRKIKIPDCIIAATALNRNLTLVTRDTGGFNSIVSSVINPID